MCDASSSSQWSLNVKKFEKLYAKFTKHYRSEKVYIPTIRGHRIDVAWRMFKRADDAQKYSEMVRARYRRLKKAEVSRGPEIQVPDSVAA